MEKAIITIHGIRWRSKKDWQNEFGTCMKSKDAGLKVFHFRYGFLPAIMSYWFTATKFLKIHSWLLNFYVSRFISFNKKLRKKFPNCHFSVIAHSFGGWILEHALAESEDLGFMNTVFVHCPISAHIENTSFWNWLEMNKIIRLFAWSSHNDPVIGTIAIKPFGQNGYWGFIRHSKAEDRIRPATKPYPIMLYNCHTTEEHSGIVENMEAYGQGLFRQLCGKGVDGVPKPQK